MRRRFFVLLLLLLASATATVAGWSWWLLHQPYRSVNASGAFEVPSGEGAGRILARLEQNGLVAHATLARAYLVYILKDRPLKAGEYHFEAPMSTPEVLDKLIRGAVVSHPVTLIEGLTLDEIAEALAEAGFGDRQRFRQAMDRRELIADLDPEATDLEGYLYPDTYGFARGTSEEEIVEKLVATFRRRFEDEVTPLRGEGGPSIRELVGLASIVEKEAQLDEERPQIAAVYRNRLQRGIALYADPTIIFALKRQGTWDGNLRRADLKLDSPYNTYRYPGLPPGPICSPGVASMIAAAAPADVPYLYFVSRNDGSHVFSTTLREHNRNVDRWQKRYWRERWAREGR